LRREKEEESLMRIALILGCILACQAAAMSLDDPDQKAAYCLGRAEFTEQFNAGFAAAGPVSDKEKAAAATAARRAATLRDFVTRKAIMADDARQLGGDDQKTCVMSRMNGEANSATCAKQTSCDDLADSLAR
jgi:hypothetical protein